MAAISIVIVLFSFLSSIIYWLRKFWEKKKLIDKIPGPCGYPIIGNVHQLRNDPHGFLEQMYGCAMLNHEKVPERQRSRMYKFWVFHLPYVIVAGAEEAADILTSKSNINKGREYSLLNSWMGTGLFTRINDIVAERQRMPWLWIDFLFNAFGRGKEQGDCLRIIKSFTTSVIEERRAELIREGGIEKLLAKKRDMGEEVSLAFMDLLLDMMEKTKFSRSDIQMEVDTFMFAGQDTTSTSMVWTTFLLGCYPEIQKRAQEEVDSVMGDVDRDITTDDLKNMIYLKCIILESLRLYPSVPIITRDLSEDCVIGNHVIPKHTHVIVAPYYIHRDPNHWPDPEKFDPDRFLPENSVGRHPFAHLPFSAGNRNCIGQKFAMMEEKTVLAWILRHFTLKSELRRDQVRPKMEIILRPGQGCKIHLNMRRKPQF